MTEWTIYTICAFPVLGTTKFGVTIHHLRRILVFTLLRDHSFLNLSCLLTFWVSNIPRYVYFPFDWNIHNKFTRVYLCNICESKLTFGASRRILEFTHMCKFTHVQITFTYIYISLTCPKILWCNLGIFVKLTHRTNQRIWMGF